MVTIKSPDLKSTTPSTGDQKDKSKCTSHSYSTQQTQSVDRLRVTPETSKAVALALKNFERNEAFAFALKTIEGNRAIASALKTAESKVKRVSKPNEEQKQKYKENRRKKRLEKK